MERYKKAKNIEKLERFSSKVERKRRYIFDVEFFVL